MKMLIEKLSDKEMSIIEELRHRAVPDSDFVIGDFADNAHFLRYWDSYKEPPRDGSSVGISKVSSPEEWPQALAAARKAQGGRGEVLVEAFVPGRETTVGLIGGQALPAIEIVTPSGWYGYEDKYLSEKTRYPFLEDGALCARLKDLAAKTYRAMGCRGVARVDFRVDHDGNCYVLELNTSPGFTAHSLVPKAGMKTGLTFAEVCEKILMEADYDHE